MSVIIFHFLELSHFLIKSLGKFQSFHLFLCSRLLLSDKHITFKLQLLCHLLGYDSISLSLFDFKRHKFLSLIRTQHICIRNSLIQIRKSLALIFGCIFSGVGMIQFSFIFVRFYLFVKITCNTIKCSFVLSFLDGCCRHQTCLICAYGYRSRANNFNDRLPIINQRRNQV